MKVELASDISKYFESLSSKSEDVEVYSKEPLERFHTWADQKPTLGTFFANGKTNLYFLLTEWRPKKLEGEFYLVVYPENKSGPIIEIREIENDKLVWTYTPRKKDGKNDKRKKLFREVYGDLTAYLTKPESEADLKKLIEELADLALAKEEVEKKLSNTKTTETQDEVQFWVEKTIVKGRPDRTDGPNKLGAALWSPQKSADNRDIYSSMREVNPGDVVFHLTDNEAVTGVSIAAAKADENFQCLGDTEWDGRPGYRVELKDFIKLENPIHRDEFFKNDKFISRLKKIQDGAKGLFYNSKLELNQGAYLSKAPKALIEIWNEVFKGKTGDNLPHVTSYLTTKRYWAGGFQWGENRKAEEFVENNYWQIGYSKNDDKKAARDTWELFNEISIGDEFAIKGYGGRNKLNIYYVGEVTELEPSQGIVRFKKLDRELYRGEAPRGKGAGSWRNTLLEATRDDVIDIAFHGAVEEESATVGATSTIDLPKNLIYYGPPGVGKTFKIINEIIPLFEDRSVSKSKKEKILEIADDLSWREAIALALIDIGKPAKVAEIKANQYVQAKYSYSSVKALKQLIWGTLQSHTIMESETVKTSSRREPLVFDKDSNSVWTLVEDWEDQLSDLVELHEKINRPDISNVSKRYEMVTFHQSYSYEDFVEGIRPKMADDSEQENGRVEYQIAPGVFRKICARAEADPERNYAIFIDEINRGNIAKIFGELITLIEEDKRAGGDNEAPPVPLLYSKKPFKVPSNLFIFGTMNTSDRSIALLDIALRRRFDFEEMVPDPEVIEGEDGHGNISALDGSQIDLRTLLSKINDRIEYLYDRDHVIGHSYFCGIDNYDTLTSTIRLKVIPLLQEYFYDDWEKIQLVLGDITNIGGQPVKPQIVVNSPLKSESLFGNNDGDLEEKQRYEVTDSIEPAAIQKIYKAA